MLQFFSFVACAIAVRGCLRINGFEAKQVQFAPPWSATPIFAYAIDDSPGEYLSTAHVDHPLSRVYSELQDPFGALGIWPSAAVACEALYHLVATHRVDTDFSLLEIGTGAGAPSLAALSLGAGFVLSTDTEELPLTFLSRAYEDQRELFGRGQLATETFNVLAPQKPHWLESRKFDVVVCSDMLYSVDVAAALGALLGELHLQGAQLVITDPDRPGRSHLLRMLRMTAGNCKNCDFTCQSLPTWAPNAADLFDGTRQSDVGLLILPAAGC